MTSTNPSPSTTSTNPFTLMTSTSHCFDTATMPSPSPLLNLPVETINQVCGGFCRHCTERRLARAERPGRHHHYSPLLALCLTSRALRAVAQPLLYHHIEFSGTHNHNPLFPLFRTLSSRPDLAASIRSVQFDGRDCIKEVSSSIRSLGSQHGSSGPAAEDLPEVIERITDAIHGYNIGAPMAWHEGVNRVQLLPPAFLQQLVLLLASGAEHIYLSYGADGVTNIFVPADPSRPPHRLPKLQFLSVEADQSAIPAMLQDNRAPHIHTLQATSLRYLHLAKAQPAGLSKVRNVHIIDCAYGFFLDQVPRIGHFNDIDPLADLEDLDACIAAHTSLENFSIGVTAKDYPSDGQDPWGSRRREEGVFNHKVQNMLLRSLVTHHKDSLRGLGIDFESGGCFAHVNYDETFPIGDRGHSLYHPLREFTNLETLSIRNTALIAHYDPNADETFSYFNLHDMLPPSIKRLHIFRCQADVVSAMQYLLERGVKRGMLPNLCEIRVKFPTADPEALCSPSGLTFEAWRRERLVAEFAELGVTLRGDPQLLQQSW